MEAWDEDENGEKIKYFSEVAEPEGDENSLKVKTFSDLSSFNYTGPKTSKIDGQFTVLKAKQFSSVGTVEDVDTEGVVIEEESKPEEKEFSQVKEENTTEQREFTQAGIRDQLRERKLGVRLFFRRLITSYKQVVKSMGKNMKPEDEQILKSMLSNEVLYVLNRVSDDIITKNKQLNTLIGASSISRNLRLACQNLQMVYRMAGIEARKQGFVSKIRYQRLQAAYGDFVNAVLDEVFKNTDNMPKDEGEEMKEEK